MYDRRDRFSTSYEDPPHCRLFIIGPKNLSEDDFRKAFQDFGQIEEIWSVKDRATGEKKGSIKRDFEWINTPALRKFVYTNNWGFFKTNFGQGKARNINYR